MEPGLVYFRRSLSRSIRRRLKDHPSELRFATEAFVRRYAEASFCHDYGALTIEEDYFLPRHVEGDGE
jgi:hypothetical protein